MYSLTFCVRVMSPERHHWKPAVQAAAVMLRTSPPRHLLVTNQRRAHTPRKLWFALCCHSNATRAPIANPLNIAQLGGSLYHASKLHPGPCSSVGLRPQRDRHRRAWPQYILRRLRLTQKVKMVVIWYNSSHIHARNVISFSISLEPKEIALYNT